MHLSIDHLIIRSGTPGATLEELADRAGLPVPRSPRFTWGPGVIAGRGSGCG